MAEGAAGRPPTADPRRRDPRLRPPGLQRLPGVGHRPGGERRLRARLSLLQLQGPGAERALRRALVAAARRDRGGGRARDPGPREARRGRWIHHRLLSPRPRADEGDHHRGHPGGKLVHAHPPARDPPGLRLDREDRPRRAEGGELSRRRRSRVRLDVVLRGDRAAAHGLGVRDHPRRRGGLRPRAGDVGGDDLSRARGRARRTAATDGLLPGSRG